MTEFEQWTASRMSDLARRFVLEFEIADEQRSSETGSEAELRENLPGN
jgi:hypothetical protein